MTAMISVQLMIFSDIQFQSFLQGCLYLWDITKGKVLRVVPLSETGCSVFIHQLCVVRNTAVVCDFGEQLQVVHFPTVLQKLE